MQIEWTDLAFDDLKAIRDFIGEDSPYYARQFFWSEFLQQLKNWPAIH